MGDSRHVGRKLVVLSGRAKGTSFVLTKSRVEAGREGDNAICLKGKRVSRHHAVLVRTNGEYTLHDLSPRIGTLLNGRPTKEATLKPGDRIRIGEFEMSYEAATAPAPGASSATAAPPLDELAVLRRQLAAAKKETDDARALAERTAGELARARADAERSVNEFQQQRIAALTQEIERLVGKAHSARGGALASGPAPFPVQSDAPQEDVPERLAAASQENAALVARNKALQAKISELEEFEAQAARLETELSAAQAGVQQLSEELARARKPTRLDAITEEVKRAIQLEPAERAGVLGRFQALLTEARAEWVKIGDLCTQVEQLALENHGLRLDMAKAQQEAALARRCLSDETNEEFDKIRRSLVAKRNEKPDKLSRFLRPFSTPPHTS